VYLCGSEKKITVKQRNRDNWYGRPESLLAQTLQKLKKQEMKPVLKIPKKKKNIPRNPRDFPSMVANSVVSGKSPYGLANRVILCMQI
jgi:hypothetical protein